MKNMLKRSLGMVLILGMIFYGLMMNVMAESNLSETEGSQSDTILTSNSAISSNADDNNLFEQKTVTADSSISTDNKNSDDSGLQIMATFTPRLTQPAANDYHYFSNNNIYYKYGYGMPNCTAYAWGRAYELLGNTPNLSTGNANSFWGTNLNRGAYAHGSTPKLGAIACWGNGYGHVAVVEKIEGNVVTISESGASVGKYVGFMFHTRTYTIGSENSSSPGGFQGYIYLGDFSNVPADTTPPSISNIQITDVNSEGFTVRCNVSDNTGVTRVLFPTWTDVNGQDDLIWHPGSLNGGEASCRINYRDHKNEHGAYTVHIYAYDAAGNQKSVATGVTIDSTPPTITDVAVVDQSSLGYTVTCKVNDASGIARVQFPTWTSANDQDDIQSSWWDNPVASGKIDGDTVTFRVNDADHNFERGVYNTHIYAIDKFGNYKVYTLSVKVENSGNIVSEETLNNHQYTLYDDAVTWSQAEKKAEELGGTLATISSQDEQSLVEKLINTGGRNSYFLGGTDEGQEGTFRWITGEPFGLAKWGKIEPNNSGGNENYLQITRAGYWNDISGTYAGGGYIVETDLAALHLSGFTANPADGSYVNGNIALSAEVSGGTAPYQYKFYYQQGDTTTIIQDYSESNTAAFKPTQTGTDTFFVDVKDSEGRSATKSLPAYIVQKNIGCTYQTQIENIGWQDPVANGDLSGTTAQGLRLESIKINLDKQGYDLGISYQTHIQNIGWEADTERGWKNDGAMSGTEGLSYRLEAIQIKLTGTDADKFDIYYQVHAENYGWLGWAKNGENSGTAGQGLRLEAIRIVAVPKGSPAPATDSTLLPFYQQ